jgi:hypothetical protein
VFSVPDAFPSASVRGAAQTDDCQGLQVRRVAASRVGLVRRAASGALVVPDAARWDVRFPEPFPEAVRDCQSEAVARADDSQARCPALLQPDVLQKVDCQAREDVALSGCPEQAREVALLRVAAEESIQEPRAAAQA